MTGSPQLFKHSWTFRPDITFSNIKAKLPENHANILWLSYRFGEEEVTIGTSAVLGRDLDALTGKFTGAGYSLPVRPSTQATNRIRIGQPDGAANRSQPVRSGTNDTSAAAGSRR